MRDYDSPQYKNWRFKVFVRHNFTCQKCFKKKQLEAHHVNNWANNEKDRFNLENGVCFCQVCHEEFHRIFGKDTNNINQLEQFLEREVDKERSTRLF